MSAGDRKDAPRAAQATFEHTLTVRATNRDEVLGQVARAARVSCPTLDAEALAACLRAREVERSTAVGGRMALPHAAIEGLEEPVLVDVTLARPVAWGEGGAPVERCVAVLVPPRRPSVHLEALARAARRMGAGS